MEHTGVLSTKVDRCLLNRWKAAARALGLTQKEAIYESLDEWLGRRAKDAIEVLKNGKKDS